jgi:hypothetical protein
MLLLDFSEGCPPTPQVWEERDGPFLLLSLPEVSALSGRSVGYRFLYALSCFNCLEL